MTVHEELLTRHQAVLPSWMALYYADPIALVDGDGRRVTDAEGVTYLDFFGGILTTMTGYNVPEITDAVKAQAEAEGLDAVIRDMKRVLRPGGWLFVSINDEHVWARCGREPDFHIARLCPRLDFSAPMEDDFVNHGEGVHAQSFWHTRAVRERWARFFEVREIRPQMIDCAQTGVLLRRPG